MLRLLVLSICLACASALSLTAPLVARAPTAARSASPVMSTGGIERVVIELEQGEPIEKALRRFRKATNMCGHLRILRNRKTFENAHDKAIRKNKESMMRQARARRSARARNGQ